NIGFFITILLLFLAKGASTLAFVFDVTGSMYDDLVQVIEGASKILEMSQSRTKRPLYNYALVPFHDPEIGPVTITTDPKKFQFELRELYVQGGGDCPEMSIGAIKIALEISLPGSFIYVFTDARSKDYKLTQEVLQLIQQKQSQVVFVLTGDCDDRAHIGYKVYEEIASTSSGQVFHLDKKQVNEVLKWVEEAVQSSKVHLLSTDHYNGVSNTWPIPFDPSLKEVTVALSGPAPDIEIRNPQGKLVGKSDGLTELLHIPNSARVVNIKDPEPGMWSIKTSSEGRHSVRISGVSHVTHIVPSHTCYFSLTGNGGMLELVSITGGVIKTLPVRYYPNTGTGSPLTGTIWNITEFVPPKEAFFLRVTGYDKDGFLFQRVSSVSFSSIVPDAPKVVMPPTTPGYYLQRGTISCQVDSLLPFTLRFTREGKSLGVDQESANALWDLAQVTLTDEGFYECIAISNAGTGHARTFLDVSEPPPAITVGGNVTATPGSSAVLTCHVASTVQFNLTWHRGGVDARLDPRRRPLANLSLDINSIGPDDAGWYECVATNEGGVSIERIYLIVQEPPQVSVDPRHQTFTTGQEVRIRCSARGYPAPHLVWTHNDMFLMGSSSLPLSYSHPLVSCLLPESPVVIVVLSEILIGLGETTILACSASGIPQPEIRWFKGDLLLRPSSYMDIDPLGGTLTIKETQDVDAGDYTCVAANPSGTSSPGKITLDVGSAPQFTREPSDVAADIGSNVTLPCHVQGYPEPQITWRREDNAPIFTRRPTHSTITQKTGGDLQISNLWVEDETVYVCEAQNQFGRIQTHARVTVTGLVPPSIQAGPRVLKVQVEHPVDLPCVARGVPQPFLAWLKDGSALVVDGTHYRTSLDGSLTLGQVGLSDQGTYTCLATSIAGRDQANVQLQVQVPPTIVGTGSPRDVSAVLNQEISLDCKVKGTPFPTIQWYKDRNNKGQTLKIKSARLGDQAHYQCSVTNAAGKQTKDFNLSVYGGFGSKPVRKCVRGSQCVTTLLDNVVMLECEARGVPLPAITWYRNGEAILSSYQAQYVDRGHFLRIPRAQASDTGQFSCRVTSVAGTAEKNFELDVYRKYPNSTSKKRKVVLTKPLNLECEVGGHPPPTLTWLKDGVPVRNGESINILEQGRKIEILSASVSDAGRYVCVATSVAGEKEINYDVSVLGTVEVGSLWFKDGQPVRQGEGVRVTANGRRLVISRPQVSDTARFQCVATNEAGDHKRDFNVAVHVPPNIMGEEVNATVMLGRSVELRCQSDAIPPPTLSWRKDGRPLFRKPGLTVLNEGRLLQIKDAKVWDTGRYTCVAVNVAGQADSKHDVNVHVPPSIVDEGTVQDAKVKEKHNVTLTCEVAGNPVPEITWLKDGQSLGTDRRHQVLSHGRYLQISGAQVDDTGRYSCLAHNRAGDRSRHFNLNVLGRRTTTLSGSAEEVTVTLSSPTSLVCEVQSYPPALITWLKDGTPLESSHNVRVLPGGRTLQILNAKEEDAGRYTCVATNEAGDSLKNYEVKVYIPPQINKNDVPGEGLAPKEVKIKVNNTLTLECEAQAIPTPSLQWYKDGQVLRADDHVTINANGRTVRIKHAQVSDTGRYTCVATNIAGEDEKDFDINIQVPPSFQRPGGVGDTTSTPGTGGDVKDVVLNNPISLYCETNAVPPPTLTWYKDGRPMASNENVLIMPGGRVLQIPRAQAEDSGRYTCLAVNEAGEDSIQYDVRVLVPPSIRGVDRDLPEEMVIQVNKTTVLECQADGSPTPKITWLKDSQPISPKGPHRLLSNGRSLQVTGLCCKKVPPTIVGASPENVTVVVNNFVSLTCEATGFPPPSLSWVKDREQTTLHTLLDCSLTPCVSFSYPSSFSCLPYTAPVHSITKILLSPLPLPWLSPVPPSIRDSSGDSPVVVSVRVGNSVTLECESNAVPPPTITWYKNGRMVTESANLRILAQGQMLELKGAEVSDTGQYVCKATNVAGQVDKNFHLNIYVPPNIDGPVEEKIVETISNPVTFACDATGIPPPSLIWLKNGRTIENSESLELHILSGGSKLQIARSQLSDSGTYTCMASNVEGKARKSYHLTIQVPPSISGSEMPSEVGVLLNDSVQLVCRSQGTPPPSIQWLKDGKALKAGSRGLRISLDGSTLTVSGAHTSDSGKYTCVATNKAGEEDRIFNLNVYVPPVIKGNSDTAVDLTTVLDSSINIECVAVGYPPPQLNWLKNGLPLPVSSQIRLLSGGQVLRIARAQLSDGGTFTCVASNRAGVDNRHYNLQVHVPPSLDGVGSKEDVTVVRGNLASLLCIADGTPSPSMSWMREGEALVPGPHIKLLNVGTTVQIIQARVEDTGRYTCVARNSAGQASRHFHLKVLDPPRINGSGVAAEVSVVVNHVLELLCEATGIPAPTLTWMKDGRPLPQTDSLRVFRGGEVLRISSPQLEDTGRYTCLANSPAGDDDKDFLVRVHVPPNIAGESTPQNVSVLQNRQVTLECKSDAVPPPALTWLKDGKPLQASPRVRILSNARYLQINMAELGDGAQYTCVASNIAGKTTRQFNLAVNVAPTIAEGPLTVAVHIDQPVVLECIVSGVPAPRVTWRKHGAILAGTNPRYMFAEDGSLHVPSAQVTDTGRYLCMATNQAGTQRKRVDLQVHVPPSISRGPTNITVTVNVQTTLSCEATGIPKPTVSWTKNGQTLNTDHNQNMYRLLSSGSLVVIAPTVEDTAEYECVVSNEAGEEARAIQLTVQVPPSIADEATELVVSRLSPLVIGCTASGVPEPMLQWSKDGMKLPKEGNSYSILSSGAIEITSSELSHSGRYSCVAKNAAGSAHRHVQLTVQEVPVIQVHPSTMDVIVNNPITLPCRATGSPLPTITWQKEGINIPSTGVFTVLPNGGLQISRAAVVDSGTYMCVAQNPAGTALGKTKLRQYPLLYLVTLDSSVTMLCQAEGSPSPSMAWHKDGQPLSESVRQRVLSSGSLQIAFAQPGDTGRYTCTAANAAGTSSLEMIPPSIRRGESEVSVVENSQAQIACVAEGVPQPTLSWEKEGTPLSDTSGEYTILPSGELVIDIAQPDDEGSYTCVATNTVGQDSQTVRLSVHTQPAFTELLADMALNKGERLVMACGVTGIPPPKITWAFNNIIIPGIELVIERVTKDNSGTYSCIAENRVGTIKSLGFVYVKEPPIIDGDFHSNRIEPLGGNAILNCEVRGDPLPTIQWSKKGGSPLLGNERFTTLSNGSLRLTSAQKEDTAEYQCVARNLLGSVLVRVTLTVRVHGGFSEWMEWGPCSVSCGVGTQRRLRQCNNPLPANGGRHCANSDTETRSCQGKPCPGQSSGPQKARGSIIGNINNVEFGIAILNATISDNQSGGRVIHATISNVPRSLGPAMRKLISILNSIYWTTAQELGEAVNGYSLTRGVFRRETQVEFATGEILRMTHVARGLDSDGALLLDIVLNGHILQLPSNADISIKDYTEDYIQTGPGQLYALSTRMFSIDRVSVPYSWNHTITYDPAKGKMPYLVETLHASAISAHYRPLEEVLEYKLHATITKGETLNNQCPVGFRLDSAGPYCADEDECKERSPCSHVCHNAMGTYYCSCPRGLTISADGRTCQDIDECSLGGHMCHDGQDCENTIGSYRCVMRCGRGFRRTADGHSCQDVNECQESNPCNQHCLNTIGSYRCACEPGYQLRNRRCIDINECRQRVCRSDQQCKNMRGSYTCIDLCPAGMTKGANGTCVDIDECRDGTHQCRYNQICENSRGSYHCTCPRGYRSQGVGRPCVDSNECEHAPQPCAHQCLNTPGSFKCVCPPGRHLLGDGKSCAGLEKLPPSYQSFSYGYSSSQDSPERSAFQRQYHSLASQSYPSYAATGGRYRQRRRREALACPQGYEARGGRCLDINECEVRDTCQHECMNTPGSHRCQCPAGYRLMTNGKTCQDIDECLEQNVQCGTNRMCFNMRGSYQCIDTPCPPNYQRDPATGFCLKKCPPNDLECALSPYALEYKLLSLPFGIAANQDLIRLVAYTQDGVVHPRTSFLVVDEDVTLPFALRDENLKGVLFTTRALREPHTFRMKVRSLSYSADGGIEYQTTFIVYIAVSAYPY
uniref:Hemicentin-1 n=1 Tax=Oncorhynchus kisutch TaxID=8019 RepID=A0A8C7MZR3_ONCKI